MPRIKTLPATTGSRRLQFRFLTVMLPVFLLVATLGLDVIKRYSFGDERGVLTARIGNLSARTATTINKLPPGTPAAQLNNILSLLMADPAVKCAVIEQPDAGVLAAAPAPIGCKGAAASAKTEIALTTLKGSRLVVRYHLDELAQRGELYRTFSYLALLGAIVIAALSSALAFRIIIGQPISALLKAIRESHAKGRATLVEQVPKDELGVVISAFNDMQLEIGRKADAVEQSLSQLRQLYNETPAMMFSIDVDGRIASASGHWLDHAGYAREDILNQPGTRFLKPMGDATWDKVRQPGLTIHDMAFKLICKDGTERDVLLNAVTDACSSKLCVLSDISSLKAAESELQKQALTDHLTGLPNRRGLFEYLSHHQPQPGKETAVLFIDLDNFKVVNDTLGHEAGDMLLKAAAGRLRNAIAKRDMLARLGGDEFAIVLEELHELSDATIVAKRIVAAFASPFRLNDAVANVGTSIGISQIQPGQGGDEVLRLADLAMYEAKQSGKNNVATYSAGMQAKVIARDIMARKIRDALLNDRFEFFLQPILNLETMKPVGAEALLRLNCPRDGMVSPAEIIQVAEETALINQITALSVAKGTDIVQGLLGSDAPKTYIAINISAHQVTLPFAEELATLLHDKPEIARSLVLEITETALFRRSENAAAILAKFRRTGCRIALDDFGTGYSSLAHLHRYPVDIIKLDRSFIATLNAGNDAARRSRALVKAAAAMASELGVDIVAEGIEDLESLELLRGFGITYGQGYLFSPPLPQGAWQAWTKAFTSRQNPELRPSAPIVNLHKIA